MISIGKPHSRRLGTPQKDECFLLKPMNCPHHCVIYRTNRHSYKELPIRLAEFGTVYRYEQHGELCGLTRVRSFTQDDAHIFCRADQVKEETNRGKLHWCYMCLKPLNSKDMRCDYPCETLLNQRTI